MKTTKTNNNTLNNYSPTNHYLISNSHSAKEEFVFLSVYRSIYRGRDMNKVKPNSLFINIYILIKITELSLILIINSFFFVFYSILFYACMYGWMDGCWIYFVGA